jgi:RNA polymerase sigma factor (sigma-70 family)
MGSSDSDFRLQLERVFAGDEQAAASLLEHYGPAILHAVRKRLSKQLRAKFDSLDFVQDVWVSFFQNVPNQRQFDTREQLVTFLTHVARNKVVDATRQRMDGRKFNVKYEHSLDDSARGGPDQYAANQPTPSEVVGRNEQWQRLIDQQPLVYQGILVLFRDGKSPAEIAEDLQISVRTVKRVLERTLARFTP